MLKASNMRAKSADELKTELGELRKENFRLRMQQATQQLTKTSELGRVRRDIAVVTTVMNERRGEGRRPQ